MSKANSKQYQAGRDDGTEDAEIASQCPPGVPLGPRPWNPAYPVMYSAGYSETFQPSPCPCDGSCRYGKPYGWYTQQQRQQAEQNAQKVP